MASLPELINIVRKESRARQQQSVEGDNSSYIGNYTVDRRTIERTLSLLENTLQLIVTRVVSTTDPLHPERVGSAVDPFITLYILSEVALYREEEAISKHFNRLAESKAQIKIGVKKESGTTSAQRGSRRSSQRLPVSTSHDEINEDVRESNDSDSCHQDDSWGQSDESSEGFVSPIKKRRKREDVIATYTAVSPTPCADSSNKRRARMHGLHQKRRNDDPSIFDWSVVLNQTEDSAAGLKYCLARVAGFAISGVSLHFHLLRVLLKSNSDTPAATLSAIEFCLNTELLQNLSFEFFYKTSTTLQDKLREALTGSDLGRTLILILLL